MERAKTKTETEERAVARAAGQLQTVHLQQRRQGPLQDQEEQEQQDQGQEVPAGGLGVIAMTAGALARGAASNAVRHSTTTITTRTAQTSCC